MCRVLLNECINPLCKRIEPLPDTLKICTKAGDRGRECSSPERENVEHQQYRLCMTCNRPKLPLESNASVPPRNIITMHGIELPMEATASSAKTNAPLCIASTFGSLALEESTETDWILALFDYDGFNNSAGPLDGALPGSRVSGVHGMGETGSTISDVGSELDENGDLEFGEDTGLEIDEVEDTGYDSPKTLPNGYTNHYKNWALRPSALLAPEPKEWEQWRKNEPSDQIDHPESRDVRYQRALETHKDRAWPLPYESYPQYIVRQAKELQREFPTATPMWNEYKTWMLGDRQFYSSDRTFLAEMAREMDWEARTFYPHLIRRWEMEDAERASRDKSL